MTAPATRRRWLAGALGAAGAYLAGGAARCASPELRLGRLVCCRSEGAVFGAEASILAVHVDQATAQRAAEAAFSELALVERLMSIYRPDSQLSLLNRDRVLERPHPYLVEVLSAAQRMSRLTGGAFDVTVQPLWNAHFRARRDGRLAIAAEIAAAQKRVDWRQVEVSPERIELHGDGAAVTLNGIAQGFAADRALARLAEYGAEGLVSAGELAARGAREDGEAWRAGIQHPRIEDAFAAVVPLDGRMLATSGDYATRFSDDFRSHHLFDPRTGRSPTELASVSILAPTAMQADALSTAVFVLGRRRGLSLIRSLQGIDALLVLKNGQATATANFPTEGVPA